MNRQSTYLFRLVLILFTLLLIVFLTMVSTWLFVFGAAASVALSVGLVWLPTKNLFLIPSHWLWHLLVAFVIAFVGHFIAALCMSVLMEVLRFADGDDFKLLHSKTVEQTFGFFMYLLLVSPVSLIVVFVHGLFLAKRATNDGEPAIG